MSTWYYADGPFKRGPVSEAEFGDLVRSGMILETTMVWRPSMRGGWMTLAEAMLEPEEQAAETALQQTMRPPAEIPGQQAPAPFAVRLLAKFIDSIVVSIPIGLMVVLNFSLLMGMAENPGAGVPEFGILLLPANVILLGLVYAYEVVMVAKSGGTFGKRILNLKVVKEDGRNLSHGAALARYLTQTLSSAFFCFGYWMALFDSERRTLHDHICRTRVVSCSPGR